MADINRVIIIGRLTRDPELKSTNTGKFFCRFSIASNRFYSNRETGERKEEVGYFDCIAFGKPAETISKYLAKGRRIGIDGSLKYSSWDTPEGQKRSKVEVLVDGFQFLDAKGEGGLQSGPAGGSQGSDRSTQGVDEPPSDASYGGPLNDEDIPF